MNHCTYLFFSGAKPQDVADDQVELAPRTLPNIGPRISIQQLLGLSSDFLGGSPIDFHVGMSSGSGWQVVSLGDLLGGGQGSFPVSSSVISIGRPPSRPSARPPVSYPARPSPSYPVRPPVSYPARPSVRPPTSSSTSSTQVPNTVSNTSLPTPADGCGISDVHKGKIVGGAPAKNGAWPWMALLGYRRGDSVSFNCGK